MELRQYAATIWKWLWLIVLSTAVAALASWLAVKDQPAIYQTSTTLMIGRAIEKADPTAFDLYTSQQLAQTYSELVKREPILKATAKALGFEDQWRMLKGNVAVNQIPNTQLMEIRVTDTDPQRTKLIVDELARQLIIAVEKTRPQGEVRQFMETQRDNVLPKIEAAQDDIQEMEARLSETFSARQIQDIQTRINILEEQIAKWQTTFASYQQMLGEGGVNVLTVIEEAPVPTTPIGPNWKLQVLLAAIIGFVLAVAAAFLIEYLDDTIKTPEDVEKVMNLTTLAGISRIPGQRMKDKLTTVEHPKSPISEAYRVLRTNLQFSSLDKPLTTLLVTSPNPTEGKSTTVANLGVVMAQAGKSVILVDADLRRPALHRIFDVENRDGLTSMLLNETIEMDNHLRSTEIENLRLLTTGPLPPNPSELLGSQRMADLIERLKEESDMVLFDSPPSLAVTDASVLATQTDGVIVVADAGRTRKNIARQAMDRLNQVGGNLTGVVLNRLRPGQGGYYYYYSYYGERNRRRRRGFWRR